jgi:hypothetical protein
VDSILVSRNEALSQQESVLKNLLQYGELTEYGARYQFDRINDREDFKLRVPLVNYPVIQEDIERMRSGAVDVLWPGQVQWYAKSSGTTSGVSKFIPVSKENIEECHFAGGKAELALYCAYCPDTKMFEGLGLRLGGSTDIHESDASKFGDLSAILIQNMPLWAESVSAPSQEVALMSDWNEKIEALAQECMTKNITSFWGVSSWFLVFAHHVLEKTGKSNLHEVWPNLELFAHGGVNFGPYRSQFEKLLPKGITFLENYNASEGFFAVQDHPKAEGMLLLTDAGVYFEFITMSAFDGLKSPTIGLGDVELGVDYALVITTNSGLWRYLIGDTVQFTSLDPFRIIVSGRTAHYINAFGEEVIVSDAENALRVACEKTDATVIDFHAAPIYLQGKTSGAHQWLVEFGQPPKDISVFIDALDNALKEENSDYAAKRQHDILLKRPELTIAKQGLYQQWLAQKGKLGGQHKVPRLSNSRTLMEEFLMLN